MPIRHWWLFERLQYLSSKLLGMVFFPPPHFCATGGCIQSGSVLIAGVKLYLSSEIHHFPCSQSETADLHSRWEIEIMPGIHPHLNRNERKSKRKGPDERRPNQSATAWGRCPFLCISHHLSEDSSTGFLNITAGSHFHSGARMLAIFSKLIDGIAMYRSCGYCLGKCHSV